MAEVITTSPMTSWQPGMDLPYVISLGEKGVFATIQLEANWLRADRSGKPLLLPPAIRVLDRLRAIYTPVQKLLTPGFIVSLREGMNLTQTEFGKKLGVSKMTVSRWECGKMKPAAKTAVAISKIQTTARHDGVKIDGEKRHSRHSAL